MPAEAMSDAERKPPIKIPGIGSKSVLSHKPENPTAGQEVQEHSSGDELDTGPDFGENLDQDPGHDDRLEWMKVRISSALCSAGDEKLYNLFKDEDAMYPCKEFIDHDSSRIVFVYSDDTGRYIANTSAPKSTKSKGLYFLKVLSGRVRMETIDDHVLVNDFDGVHPLQQLLAVAQEVYFPLICNSKNQEGWPEVIAKEVTDNFNRFVANTYITLGQNSGNTILPLPPKDVSSSHPPDDQPDFARDKVHLLENAVVTWTRQIKSILKLEPEQMLKGTQNPGPGMEVEFWEHKACNLNSIHEQLNGEKIRKIMDVLEATKSTYYPAFDRLCKEVAVARDEANDTLVYLRPASRYFRLLLAEDFLSVNSHFRPILHVTLLVWKTSRFYNTPSRLVVLIREMCNDVIRQACKYMSRGESKWHAEPRDSLEKLKKIIEQSLDFKEIYFLYRNKSNKVCPDIPWNFQSSALFARLDSFLERCHDVLDLMQTLTQFKTLEQVKIGGTKGKTLTSSVHQIYFDFQQCVLVFQEAQYDVMDVDVKQFDEHFHDFRKDVNELERRLSSVIMQAFEDSTTILGSFKLLDSFETLLEREIMHAELEHKQADLLKEYLQDMLKVQEIFGNGKITPPVSDNGPPHAGAVAWVRGLLQRVDEPMKRLRGMSKIVLDADEGRDVEKMYAAVVKALNEYQLLQIEKWAKNVSNTSEAKLKLPLLRRDEGDLPLLQVNFDPGLVCLLREVKYFLALGVEVPAAASALYDNEEVFRVQRGNLDLIVNLYNQILQTLLDVEKPLVQQKMDNIDKVLQRGLVHMNWKSHTITVGIQIFYHRNFRLVPGLLVLIRHGNSPDFISQCTTIVKEVHGIVHVIKDNLNKTRKILDSWSEDLLLERKPTRTYTPDEMKLLQEELMQVRYAEMISGSEQIHAFLGLSQKTLRANRGSMQFKGYIDHVNHIFIDGLASAVLANCRYLLLQVDHEYLAKYDINPLLEVQIKLQGDTIVFMPELGRTGAGIGDLIFHWITSFCNIGMLVRRIDTPTPDGNYLADIQENRKVKYMISVINTFINDNAVDCEEFRQSFEEYSYLWLDDVQEQFEEFLQQETFEGEEMPSVHAFEDHISQFRLLEDEIRELPGTKVIGWLKIDVRPLRNALLTYVSKWSHVFQQYPLSYIIRNVAELASFVQETEQGVMLDVIDTESLIVVLTHLLAIKKREKETDLCFDPLKTMLHMLVKQEVQVPVDLQRELHAVHENWIVLKQKALVIKDRHAGITAKEATLLKERGKQYEQQLAEFRAFFLQAMPFQYSENAEKSYATIDDLHHGTSVEHLTVVGISRDMEDINRLQECFEVDIVDYTDVETCRRESILLKFVWDAIALVLGVYSRWQLMRWSELRVDDLQEKNERLLEHVKELDSNVHKWGCFEDLMKAVTDMKKTLPLLKALNHPAMRPRHWKQLMRATGVSFETDERLCLGDLLSLKLHLFEEGVLEIVDRAQKEQLIERQLTELDKVWGHLNLQFEVYYDDPMTNVITVDDVLLDNLKQNIVLLQQMQTFKYVQSNTFFLDKVMSWQERLGTVDNVLVIWMEVQTKWCNLRSIYFDSSDIKEKLPEETKSFMEISQDWKALMKESATDPNVIRACNAQGRSQRLEGMLECLELCERALADYLESKRVRFPRLYFLSDDDLLDILSKGKYPRMIMKHLKSCLDGVVELRFEDGQNGDGKMALGAVSPEGEYLPFVGSYECTGDVEAWLLLLTEHIQKTIETTITTAVPDCVEKEKRDFLSAQCAQIACIALRLHFCLQVVEVLDHVEQGNANALDGFLLKLQTSLDNFAQVTGSDLEQEHRIKITTVITLEIEHRDIVSKFIAERIESREAFAWSSQLRYTLDEETGKCTVSICDYQRLYGNEYIGNCGCLVSTPLIHRANITLTQAVRLYLGGAITGPAGTGKTETTKDLARNFGLIYYIFNCSDQITSTNIGLIFKGLAYLGAWACLDDFNRIDLPVLSVASSHFKAVLDAQKARKDSVLLQGSEIKITPGFTSTAFITMYQDYDRAVEIPESLRALFRPCAMVKPEIEHIVEVLLTSQGFAQGKILARKCVLLYSLSECLLSNQHYYDWKLRAIKTALLVAGDNLRRRQDLQEDELLLMVLRDFNLARLAPDDVLVFLNLLKSLFPSVKGDITHQYDPGFQEKLLEACQAHSLQPDDGFTLKALQFRDILSVRWTAYVLGPASCGKSAMLCALSAAQNLAEERTSCIYINPKAISRNELFGHRQAHVEKWQDGILTHSFREFAVHRTAAECQMLILDGDIDPYWIESMNTVMDQNKTLTLASGERIPLTPAMRLVFESASMQHASPGTISRGGVVYMDEYCVGWSPYARSWVGRLMHESERSIFTTCFDKYVPPCLEFLQTQAQAIVPLPKVNLVVTLCQLLSALLENGGDGLQQFLRAKGEDEYKVALESMFAYAAVWGLGGSLSDNKNVKYSSAFDRFWRETFTSEPSFPENGTIFDYFFDKSSCKYVHWKDKFLPHTHVSNLPFRNIYVGSPETSKVSHAFGLLVGRKVAVMLVGLAGTGKTAMVKERLRNIKQVEQENSSSFMEINLNFYTDSQLLQTLMESGLEKKTGRVFGPRGCKQLIYFIDDLNMPQVDKYGTQQSIAFLLQHLSYQFWYDRTKLTVNEVHDIQFAACMNPAVGSYTVDPRLQACFATFSVDMPSEETIFYTYSSIVTGYFSSFDTRVQKVVSEALINATVNLYKSMTETFTATPAKMQYVFNMRDISAVVKGLCRALRQYYSSPPAVIRLWLHECERVFGDRLVSHTDIEVFQKMLTDVSMKWCDEYGEMNKILAKPILFTTFCSITTDGKDPPYCGVSDFEKLAHTVEEKLAEYNEVHAMMELVLFDEAIMHVCRIARVIGESSGNALLVGIGGSGKQSLSRLSAYICGYEILENTVDVSCDRKTFEEIFKVTQVRAGRDDCRIAQIITDKQISDEGIMILLNDFLSSGNVGELYTIQEKLDICDAVKPKVQAEGIIDSFDNCWEFYLEAIRQNLHLCLCFSPANESFCTRCRQFPALINATSFNFFHPWQHEALVAVADRLLSDVGLQTQEDKESLALHMAFVHTTISTANEEFLLEESRHNFATPKGFLDYVDTFKYLLDQKKSDIISKRERLQLGLEKLRNTADDIASLQEKLTEDMALVAEKTDAADVIMKDVEEQTKIADAERYGASDDEASCATIQEECERLKRECEEDFKSCQPILNEAEMALQTLDKKNLTELKSLPSPPPGVEDVLIGVMVLTSKGSIPKDLSWASAKKVMANVDNFIKMLLAYDKESITESAVAHCEKVLLSKDTFNPDRIRTKSSAASGMCSWVINICQFYRVFQTMLPKKRMLEEASRKLSEANEALADVRTRLKQLDDELSVLTTQYQAATQEKTNAENVAQKTNLRLEFADRLMVSLAEEEVRWTEEVVSLASNESLLLGSVLLSSAFVSYVGAFNAKYRKKLLSSYWMPDVQERRIEVLDSFHPLDLLVTDAQIARWTNEGLPVDTISQENAVIISTSRRTPLIIDPQLQAIGWLKTHCRKLSVTTALEGETNEDVIDHNAQIATTSPESGGKGSTILKMNQATCLQELHKALALGEMVIIENLGEDIDPVLESILSRSIMKSANGKHTLIRVGDKFVEYHPNFKLYLQTKLSNPHFKPEVVAQATVVNFTITPGGLQEQLLSLVLRKERHDLFEERSDLLESQNSMRMRLNELENSLLEALTSTEGDILADLELISSLESTKETAKTTEREEADLSEAHSRVFKALETYRPIASRGVLLYFLIESLWKLDDLYHFSLVQCIRYFEKGLDLAPDEDVDEEEEKRFQYNVQRKKILESGLSRGDGKEEEDVESQQLQTRVETLKDSACLSLFLGVSQGLFPHHKLIFAAELCFRGLIEAGSLHPVLLAFLVRPQVTSPVMESPFKEWLDAPQWQSVVELSQLELPGGEDEQGNMVTDLPFESLQNEIMESSRRFRDWHDLERPEESPLPGDWKKIPEINKLLVIRALRPDRFLPAMSTFVKNEMGYKFLIPRTMKLSKVMSDSSNQVPILFVLTPGVDPVKEVEALGEILEIHYENKKLALVCLGQGQEAVAEATVDAMSADGGWVFLQNLHLLKAWTSGYLEEKVEDLAGAHQDFRLFVSTEPSFAPIATIMVSIKLTNEAPDGLKANLLKAMQPFDEEFFEASSSAADLKAIVFGVCVLHAVLVQRKKFGAIGWNQLYPFNLGDLHACGQIARKQIETSERVPWQDLRFMFGDVIYGGHTTDAFDRHLLNTYLEMYACDELPGGFEILPGWQTPTNWDDRFEDISASVLRGNIRETSATIGLHSNVEISIILDQGDELSRCIGKLRTGSLESSSGASIQERTGSTIDEVLEKMPTSIILPNIDAAKADESSPYVHLLQQEVVAHNNLLRLLGSSMSELRRALLGELQISPDMQDIMEALADSKVPRAWEKAAYPSRRALGAWVADLGDRSRHLREWCLEPHLSLPKVTWLPGLFAPKSFLTAVQQFTANRNGWALDQTQIQTEVTKKTPEEIGALARDGAYIFGLFLEGASWDSRTSSLENAKSKELVCEMPAILIKAVIVSGGEQEQHDLYQCPLYKTRQRGPSYTWLVGLRSKVPTSHWVVAGVALTLEP